MIDPTGDTDVSLQAQKTLMERYDILPFDFHHELPNTTQIAQDMLIYMRDSIENDPRDDVQAKRETTICQIQAYKKY